MKKTSVSPPSPGSVSAYSTSSPCTSSAGAGSTTSPAETHLVALDLEVDDERLAGRPDLARGLEDAAEVGVAAVERGLHERRVRDRAGHRLDGVRVAAHDHAAHPPRALAVVHDLERELAKQRVERLAERELVGRLGLHAHARGAVRERDDRVARGELAVDADAVEGALHAHAGEEVERRLRRAPRPSG